MNGVDISRTSAGEPADERGQALPERQFRSRDLRRSCSRLHESSVEGSCVELTSGRATRSHCAFAPSDSTHAHSGDRHRHELRPHDRRARAAGLSFEVIDREKAMVRLGAGGLDGKALTAEAMTAALQALSKFKRLAESHRVDKMLAAATSATREASNGGEFLARVERETGIRPRVITGPEEARLIHQAAVYGVDVGGGAGRGHRHRRRQRRDHARHRHRASSSRAASSSASSGSPSDSCKSDPLSGARRAPAVEAHPRRDRPSLRADRRHRLRPRHRHVRHDPEPRRRRATDGPRAHRRRSCATCGSRPSRFAAAAQGRLVDSISSSGWRCPGWIPRRADLVVAGAVLLDTILRRLGAEELTLCDLALREGLVLDYIRRNKRQIAQVDRIPDVRRRSTHRAGRALQLLRGARAARGAAGAGAVRPDAGAARPDRSRARVARVRGADARHRRASSASPTPPAFVLPDQERRPARVRAGGDRSASRWWRGITAAARRRRSHEEYAELPAALRRTVRTLASILRVAESLDRSHAQVMSGLEVRRSRHRPAGTAAHVIGCGAGALGDASLPRTVREAGAQTGAPRDGRRHARGQDGTTNGAGQPRFVNEHRGQTARHSGAPQDVPSYRLGAPTRRPLSAALQGPRAPAYSVTPEPSTSRTLVALHGFNSTETGAKFRSNTLTLRSFLLRRASHPRHDIRPGLRKTRAAHETHPGAVSS